jgi:3'-phosphoadenosine 5'-phosphosulfate (PAPS) 3'-phosphatase
MAALTRFVAVMAVAKECIAEVGPIVLKAFFQPKQLMSKSSIVDLVTEWDKTTEKLILARIRSQFPTHHIVAEESHDGHYDISDEPTWYGSHIAVLVGRKKLTANDLNCGHFYSTSKDKSGSQNARPSNCACARLQSFASASHCCAWL